MFGSIPVNKSNPTATPGKDGQDIELRATASYIQWRYKGFRQWNDLISIKALIGPPGPAGKPGTPGKDGQNGKPGIQGIAGNPGKTGSQGPKGSPGRDGLDGLDGKDGKDGREIELQTSPTHIQWRYVGEAEWKNLIAIADLKGPKGEKGDPGEKGDRGERGATGYPGSQGPRGAQGFTGPAGPTGATGPAGADGVGVPAGGATGQALVKTAVTDYVTGWQTLPSPELTWDSSLGANAGTSFNNFPDLYDFKRVMLGNGSANVTVIQSGSQMTYYDGPYSPSGAYNLTGMSFIGNGGSLLLGSGIFVIIADGVTFSAWTPSSLAKHLSAGIGFVSFADNPIMNIAGFSTIVCDGGSGWASNPTALGATYSKPFFTVANGAFFINALLGGSVGFAAAIGGYEIVDVDAGGNMIFAVSGSGTNLDVNSVRGTGLLNYVFSDSSASTDLLTLPQANFSGTTAIDLYPNSLLTKFNHFTTKGDLLVRADVATNVSLAQRLGVGSDGQVLTADSADSKGLSYKHPAAISSAPATATSPGVAGQIAFDSSFFYVCTAADTWVRTPLNTW